MIEGDCFFRKILSILPLICTLLVHYYIHFFYSKWLLAIWVIAVVLLLFLSLSFLTSPSQPPPPPPPAPPRFDLIQSFSMWCCHHVMTELNDGNIAPKPGVFTVRHTLCFQTVRSLVAAVLKEKGQNGQITQSSNQVSVSSLITLLSFCYGIVNWLSSEWDWTLQNYL